MHSRDAMLKTSSQSDESIKLFLKSSARKVLDELGVELVRAHELAFEQLRVDATKILTNQFCSAHSEYFSSASREGKAYLHFCVRARNHFFLGPFDPLLSLLSLENL